ncbi:MAG: hypothetical protein HQ402_00795 [Parcubacteria group bacterium]|nr:hypothetical protein [Parcubacteria group bacterium]
MKAIEYAEEWRASGKSQAKLGHIIIRLILETKALVESRSARSNTALVAVIKEVDQKWRSLVSMFPGELNPDGFKIILLIKIEAAKEIAHLIWPTK